MCPKGKLSPCVIELSPRVIAGLSTIPVYIQFAQTEKLSPRVTAGLSTIPIYIHNYTQCAQIESYIHVLLQGCPQYKFIYTTTQGKFTPYRYPHYTPPPIRICTPCIIFNVISALVIGILSVLSVSPPSPQLSFSVGVCPFSYKLCQRCQSTYTAHVPKIKMLTPFHTVMRTSSNPK